MDTPTPPVHPGEVLKSEYLDPRGITAYRVARDIGVPVPRMYNILKGTRGISPDTALRLGRYFNTSPRFFMNLQSFYELQKKEKEIDRELTRITPYAEKEQG